MNDQYNYKIKEMFTQPEGVNHSFYGSLNSISFSDKAWR